MAKGKGKSAVKQEAVSIGQRLKKKGPGPVPRGSYDIGMRKARRMHKGIGTPVPFRTWARVEYQGQQRLSPKLTMILQSA